MPARLLDTNVILRFLTGDHSDHSPKAATLLLRVERGDERVAISPMVIFEVVFTLQHSYRAARAAIRQRVLDIINLRGVQLPDKDFYARALDVYVEQNISFADAFNVAYMEAHKIGEVYSWDRDFDRFPHLRRIEPNDLTDLASAPNT